MATTIRLTRRGGKKVPAWRIVVTDSRKPRDGRFIESLGHYDPKTDPSVIELNEEKAKEWLSKGAQPSATVKKLLKIKGIV